MLRRQARQRREYIYKKSIEERERTIAEKKQRLKRSLDENNVIPTDLRKDALDLQKTLDWEDEGGEGVTTHIDDEYRWAGVEDPKLMITTSRDPSSRLKQFAKEIRLIFPNSQRINRGNYEMKQLVQACRSNDVTDLILLHEHRGNPDGLVVCHLPYGPTAYFTLSNVVMRHDIPDVGKMSEAYPHLILNNFTSKLGQRVSNILKYLFPVPKEDSRRVITFANQEDYISFRHHTYKKKERNDVELSEVGPRFEMKLYQIILGTLDNADSADVEWVFRPYMNTTKKRRFLAD
ncbi:U3 small nucleolar ribonucleoprotein protein IMP4 [Lingula anatina]|uniref:U3 small nucleolar ribonucleoprotein protein IMP4 n=1 Tax=Lingula anatina TaxID=7574 RepID=A0A1S3I770_LINAN|nr:U3 small nucleolar ribonucleoprotein protein IMP4 [Lingula anatina]|eukprot:XP_013394125.1 U3 small nucleolar ribonucleoprotein protein IMP4 [Lingula anatina]